MNTTITRTTICHALRTLQISLCCYTFFFSSRRRHTRLVSDWSSDVCSSDLRRKRCAFRRTNHVLRLVGTTHQVKRETQPAFCPSPSGLKSLHAGRTESLASPESAVPSVSRTLDRKSTRLNSSH